MRFSMFLLLVILAGCAGPSAPAGNGISAGALTVEQALRTPTGRAVAVRGYVVIDRDGTAHLCSGLAGSYPPQCGRPMLELRRLDPSTLRAADRAEGITWTGETTVSGTMTGAVLDVGPEPH